MIQKNPKTITVAYNILHKSSIKESCNSSLVFAFGVDSGLSPNKQHIITIRDIAPTEIKTAILFLSPFVLIM